MQQHTAVEQVKAPERSAPKQQPSGDELHQDTRANEVADESPSTVPDALRLARALCRCMSALSALERPSSSRRHDLELAHSLTLHVIEILYDIDPGDEPAPSSTGCGC